MPKGLGYTQAPSATGSRRRKAPSGIAPVRGMKSKRKKRNRGMMAAR